MSETCKSFKEVQQKLGFKPRKQKKNTEPKEEKEIKCKICGAPMRKILGTNTIVCTGTVKDKEGNIKPCGNFILTNN